MCRRRRDPGLLPARTRGPPGESTRPAGRLIDGTTLTRRRGVAVPHRVRSLALSAALLLPSAGSAQDYPPYPSPFGGGTVLTGPRAEVGAFAGPAYGPGFYHSGWPYGPRVAAPWGYYGLAGGPYVGYPLGYPFLFGFGGRVGQFWSNGLSLYGPPVPTYGPVPGVFGNSDLVRRYYDFPAPGLPFGWVGIYAASPRPRPLTVNVWPTPEGVGRPPFPAAAAPAAPGGCLVLSVRVPQPAAEVFVDGVRTAQTGTDRVFESPVLEAGKEFRYEVTARWVEGGAVREARRWATGTPGEVVRVDFTAPEVAAGK
ncbi:MAG: hypothetical protein C0501_03210 [Isosphaera sp.]|nr:hypothetical protein [Isosphaera sp.]